MGQDTTWEDEGLPQSSARLVLFSKKKKKHSGWKKVQQVLRLTYTKTVINNS